MKEMWNERYSAKAYAYGIKPNEFFKQSVDKYGLSGRVLFPAEGEGRNAVFAAKKGIDAEAFDISIEGKKKALLLAEKENVSINYQVGDLLSINYEENSFDAIVLIYAHFPPNILSLYHQKFAKLLKNNGLIILEGFSKNNLPLRINNPKVGGPDKLEMLFSEKSIEKDFPNFEVLELDEVEIELNEGEYHIGHAKVIRFVGKKEA